MENSTFCGEERFTIITNLKRNEKIKGKHQQKKGQQAIYFYFFKRICYQCINITQDPRMVLFLTADVCHRTGLLSLRNCFQYSSCLDCNLIHTFNSCFVGVYLSCWMILLVFITLASQKGNIFKSCGITQAVRWATQEKQHLKTFCMGASKKSKRKYHS